MRINGMEATSVSSQMTNSGNIPTTTNNVPAAAEIKIKVKDRRSPSQISDFERRELPISEKVVIDAIERVNKVLTGSNRKFEISIHEKTNEIMVKVINSETNELIREIPPEKILDMVAKLWELAGLIVDERR